MLGNSIFSAIRILMMIPFLGAMGYGLLMTKYSYEMQSGESGFATELITKVSLSYLDGMLEDRKTAVVDTTALSSERQVTVSKDFPIGTFGLDAATMSEDEMEVRLFGQGKVLAEAECRALIQGFAKSCRLDRITVNVRDDGSTGVNMMLSFNALADPGDLSNADGRALLSERTQLVEGYQMKVKPAELAEVKAGLVAKATTLCDALKASTGNCMITEIRFAEEPDEDGLVKLRAEANLASLGAVGSATPGTLGGAVNTGQATKTDGMLNFLKSHFTGDAGTAEGPFGEMAPAEAPGSSQSLLDDTKLPGFKKTQGGAKFVSPP